MGQLKWCCLCAGTLRIKWCRFCKHYFCRRCRRRLFWRGLAFVKQHLFKNPPVFCPGHKRGEGMTFNDYQEAAVATAVYPKDKVPSYATLGLVGEAGELANKVKKLLRGDYVLDEKVKGDLVSELGDVLWYAAALATDLGVSLSDVAYFNIEKLAARKAANTIKGTGDNR